MSTEDLHRENINISPVVGLLGVQQRALESVIEAANKPGNLEGLFAFHILGDQPDLLSIVWDVNSANDGWLVANRERVGHFPILAVIGYALYHFGSVAPPSLQATFLEGMERLRLRDPFPDDRVSFVYQPVAFLGLALGSLAIREIGATQRTWLVNVLTKRRRNDAMSFHLLLYGYVSYVLQQEAMVIDDVRRYNTVDELALLEYGIRRGAFRLVDPRADLSELQARVLRAALAADINSLDTGRAALVWTAMYHSLIRSIDRIVLSRDHVSALLRNFEDGMRRWRWDDEAKLRKPIHWPITSEREVQDIVWLILRSVFDDVIDEETLPKLGHSTYRADFAIPSLRLLVEVKFARQASDFKSYEKEIMEDAIGYLIQTKDRYDQVLVFIYDHSSSVQEHGLTAAALRKLPQIKDVIIVSRPSQLPAKLEDML